MVDLFTDSDNINKGTLHSSAYTGLMTGSCIRHTNTTERNVKSLLQKEMGHK